MTLSPINSRDSSPASSDDEQEHQAAARRKVQFAETAARTARPGEEPEASTSTFVPPKGLKKAAGDEALSEFSLEAIKQKLSSGCELWAIRLPQNLGKLRYLNDVKISLPDHADSSTTAASQKVGHFDSKKNTYDIYSLTDNIEDVSDIGAGEMRNLTALVANKKRKYTAVPIQRHIVINQALSFPPEKRAKSHNSGYVNHEQPEGLTGFFEPYGYQSAQPRSKKPAKEPSPEEDRSFSLPPLPSPPRNHVAPQSMEIDELASSAQASPSKEERKRLKKEKKERKEEKRKRKSTASEAA